MENLTELAFFTLLQLVVTWIMAGIMWFTQVVHYPLYKKIKEGFIEYKRSHIRRATLLIGPLMLIEAISAIILVHVASGGIVKQLAWINIAIMLLIWFSTFLIQITQQQKLSIHFSFRLIRNLIHSNWIRTLLWTSKGCLIAWIMFQLLTRSAT